MGIGAGGRGDLLATGTTTGAEVTPYAYGGANGMQQSHGGLPASLLAGGAGAAGVGAYGLAHANTQHSHSNSAGSSHDVYARSDDTGSHYPPSSPNASSGAGYSYGTSPYAAVGAVVASGYAHQHGPGQHPSPGPSIPSSGGNSHYGPLPPGAVSPPDPNYNLPPGAAVGAAALPAFRSAKEREAYMARHRIRDDTLSNNTLSPVSPTHTGPGGYYTYPSGTNPNTTGFAVRNSGTFSDGDGDRATSVSGGVPGTGGGSGGSAASADGSNVVVHQDGGRVPEEDDDSVAPNEIPPTYDSIRRDA